MKRTLSTINPGATIGVLGSGQLGRMFAIAARRLGYRVHTFSPETDTPTGQAADVEITGNYEDTDAIAKFARAVDVVTFEFENVPGIAAQTAAQYAPVRPGGEVLHITQNRLREKRFLAGKGFPVTPFRAIHTISDIDAAISEIGADGVLKTAGFGYDGKGQVRIRSKAEAHEAMRGRDGEMILESLVDFEIELSVIGARGIDGSFAHWGVVANQHAHHILDVSVAPAEIPEMIYREAIDIARSVLESLDVVGVLCVELFLDRAGRLLINELAPRPHNSGHFTIDACITSQFEQQLRAVCGLPLGATDLLQPAAMANLLGDLWASGEPDWAGALSLPEVKLHLYGKRAAVRGRKMGHLTALAETPAIAAARVRAARALLAASQGLAQSEAK